MNLAVHLTEDQIDDLLIGDPAPECEAHLSGCAECRARVAEIEAPLASFRNVSLAWSERESATMPVRSASFDAQEEHGHRGVWAAAATAVIAVGVTVPLVRNSTKASIPATPTASTQTFAAEREEQIARDNQMLRAIDRELDASVSSPSETFDLQLGPEAGHPAHNAPIPD